MGWLIGGKKYQRLQAEVSRPGLFYLEFIEKYPDYMEKKLLYWSPDKKPWENRCCCRLSGRTVYNWDENMAWEWILPAWRATACGISQGLSPKKGIYG